MRRVKRRVKLLGKSRINMLIPKLKRYQKKFNYSYSFGAYPTLDLLRYRKEDVLKVLIKEDALESGGVEEVVKMCREADIRIEVNDRCIEKIAYKENTFVVGVFNKYESELETSSNHVVLDNPSNMGNMGTIIRSMVGFSFKNLGIIKPSVDIFDPMVIRSAMGAFFHINFEFFDNIQEYITKYKNHNLYPFMLDGAKSISDVSFEEPFAIVQGNEGRGLPSEYSKLGQSVYIPHEKDIDSLNLSIATGIGLWEVYKKKK